MGKVFRSNIIFILPLFLIRFVLADVQTFNLNQIQSRLSAIETSIERLKEKSEAKLIRSEIESLSRTLKLCEDTYRQEVESLLKITDGKEVITNASRASGANNEIVETELTTQSQLNGCRYFMVKLNSLKDKLVVQLSKKRLADYLKKTEIYWGEDSDILQTGSIEKWSLLSKSATNHLPFMLQILLVLFLYALIVTVICFFISEQKPFSKKFDQRSVISTVVCIAVIGLAHLVVYKMSIVWMDSFWMAWISLSMIPGFLIASKRNRKIGHGLSYLFIIMSSLLLLSDLVWMSLPIVHGVVFLILYIAIFFMMMNYSKNLKRWIILSPSIITLALEIFEYHTAAHQFMILYLSLIIFVNLSRLTLSNIDFFISLLKFGKHGLLDKFRHSMGINRAEELPGTAWIKWTVYIFSIVILLLGLMDYSGIPENIVEMLHNGFFNGIDVGTISINPKNILVATFVLGILLSISRFFRIKIERNYIKDNSIETSGQTAVTSLFWYSAVISSFLIALAICGFSVQHLALIAGAFSVGIGFGLQNIVSNFISGIILLIEKPVKSGDWVQIGGTEGFIQKISIRATQIRTFDKSDILIPNSELISNQVTNWMLNDKVGRLRVSVGVAYGSDTKRVFEVLEKVAKENKDVVNNDEALKPSILFMGFGDSSLNFEVRCFLHDIITINKSRSDLNLAIDQAFREANIEIPFPQRDVHMKGA